MVCSEKELGLSDEHEGIMVLEADAPVGAPLADCLGDTVIEFEITPNLVHAFSILGIAREVSALTRSPDRALPPLSDLIARPAGPAISSPSRRPTFARATSAVVIEGIKVGPSPAWMQRRLLAAGLRPINNVVDVTNYVMLECGQPLHAFDATRSAGAASSSAARRRAKRWKRSITRQRHARPRTCWSSLTPRTPVGVAGVMGGLDSEITDRPRRILLESANFDMKSVRHTARALRLRTDASARFERGLDPNLAGVAAARATRFCSTLSRRRRDGVADVYPNRSSRDALTMPFAGIERLLGVRYPPEQVLDVLNRLGFSPESAAR